ncbi:phytoene desaturase family protein [Blastopirellula retiformator]|uniref:Phytoene desaturase (Neurosporene-forming) n=1 Tax=Blastopirellula retiformator TaxID=2527970 RepID=A0A5C5UVU1_9BACT|nr:NAD(P)/FAD-dependent oxidoreductase [Blastopirellula retiformator]TWT29667.1 Phytoene desaturase (neurosporene-forming) [Blastopirellula retiformator]
MYDAIIIGAGMSGLSAGIRLAYYGQNVCILERHYTIGGLNSFYRMAGRDFDVGLHAVTNYAPKGDRRGPLGRLLRQLRFKWEEFALCEQRGSLISFPDVQLAFDNDIELLKSEVATKFPGKADAFQQLLDNIIDYDDISDDNYAGSAREILMETLGDPLLVEMILCPLMWYGNARERDMDWGQFCIMFRSIFLEGFARPYKGVRLLLKNLVRKYRELGGELRLRNGVQRIVHEEGKAVGVVLDSGEELQARKIISSAGWFETMRMCGQPKEKLEGSPGVLSFIESISVLNQQPKDIGFEPTIVFYNDSDKFHWEMPKDEICDTRTGVICSPNNFLYPGDSQLDEGFMRITTLANFDRWMTMSDEEYRLAKLKWYDAAVASAVRFVPDFRRHIVATDMFTPKTIHRYTWHDNGAVYGAPDKRLSGETHLQDLYICGTDQGFVGIIGSIVSGLSIANRHVLQAAS